MKRISILVLLGITIAACGGNDTVQIDDPWARTSASMQNAGAVYMAITGGNEADRLIGVKVDESIAAMAQIHETSMTENDEGTEMMQMQEVSSIEVGAGSDVVLEPGGYHIMLMQLAEPLQSGSEFEVTLTFENAGDIEVKVEVRDN